MSKYNIDLRVKAIDLAERIGMQEAARQLGIHLNTLANWKKKLNSNGLQALHNLSRQNQKHPGQKLSQTVKKEILDLKKHHPDLTHGQIKEQLGLDCNISLISRVLKQNSVEYESNSNDLVLTYKIIRCGQKTTYVFYLLTPACIFMAEHDELDTEFITSCCRYWLEKLGDLNTINSEFKLDISSLYLILKDKKREKFAKTIKYLYNTTVFWYKKDKKADLSLLECDYNVSMTALQLYLNYRNYRNFIPVPAISGNISQETESEKKLILEAVIELKALADRTFFYENLTLASNIYNLIIKCCEYLDICSGDIYRHCLLYNGRIISCNQSFRQAEDVFKKIIEDNQNDFYAGLSWFELARISYYNGHKENAKNTIVKAEEIFSSLLLHKSTDARILHYYSQFAVFKKDNARVLELCDLILAIPETSRNLKFKSYAMFDKACFYYDSHDYESAVALFNQLLAKHEWPVSNFIKAKIHFNLAQLIFADQNIEEYEKQLNIATSKAELVGYQLLLAKCRQIEGEIWRAKQDYKQAVSCFMQSLEIFKRFECIRDVCTVSYQIAQVFQSEQKYALQLKWAKSVLKYSLIENLPAFTVTAYDMICMCYLSKHNYVELARYACTMLSKTNFYPNHFFYSAALTYIAVSSIKLAKKNADEKKSLAMTALESCQDKDHLSLYNSLKKLLLEAETSY